VMTWFNPKTSKKWGFALSAGKRLFIHARLGVTVENPDRVHVAGIDIDGEVRWWAVERSRSGANQGGWWFRDSLVIGRGSPAAPNPWTDVALTYAGPNAGYAAVAGVDEAVDDPERRTMAFRAGMFAQRPLSPISND